MKILRNFLHFSYQKALNSWKIQKCFSPKKPYFLFGIRKYQMAEWQNGRLQ